MTDYINCRQCIHYYVTWDPASPMGCKLFGFKSKRMPSEVVKASSGESCKGFSQKNRPENNK